MVKLIASRDYIAGRNNKIAGTILSVGGMIGAAAAVPTVQNMISDEPGETPVKIMKPETIFVDHDTGIFYHDSGNGEYEPYVAQLNASEAQGFFDKTSWDGIKDNNFKLVPTEDGEFKVKAVNPITDADVLDSDTISIDDAHDLWEQENIDMVFEPYEFVSPTNASDYRVVSKDVPADMFDEAYKVLESNGYVIGDAGFRGAEWEYTTDAQPIIPSINLRLIMIVIPSLPGCPIQY